MDCLHLSWSYLITMFATIMASLKFATINVGGMHDPVKRAYIFQHLLANGVDIVALQETHCSNSVLQAWVDQWEGLSEWNCGDSKSSGTAFLFRPNLNVHILDRQMDFNGRVLALSLEMDECKFQILNTYAPNPETKAESEDFFANLQYFFYASLPAIICGDFNMVENLTEDRKGGTPRDLHTFGLPPLQELKAEHKLVDIWRHLHPKTRQFSWHSKQANISSRLDRIYVDSTWTPLVKSCYITPFVWSDHDMVVMSFSLPNTVTRGRGFWKMNLTLLEDDSFKADVEKFWAEWKKEKMRYSDPTSWWDLGKSYVKRLAIDFSVRKQQGKRVALRELQNALQAERARDVPDMLLINELVAKIKRFHVQQNGRIFIATHTTLIEPGETPTKQFFHLLAHRENQQSITALQNSEGHIVKDQENIIEETRRYFAHLYTKEGGLNQEKQNMFLRKIHRVLPEADKHSLQEQIALKELKEALDQTEVAKTPGCDGLPYEFYKTFWQLLGTDLHEVCLYSLSHNAGLAVSQRTSLIALLYKKGDKHALENWRPISLLCTDYKILAKALSNRLKQKLHLILHTDQTCGVPGRTINEKLFLTRDLISYANQKGTRGYIVTLDQEKAVDRLDRGFLFQVMKKMNFGDSFISWIRTLYRDTQSSVLVNGHVSMRLPVTRGVRQGCPLSAFLYTIYAETLGEEIRTNPNIHGIFLPGNQEVRVMQYADDITIYLSRNTQ